MNIEYEWKVSSIIYISHLQSLFPEPWILVEIKYILSFSFYALLQEINESWI